MVIIRSKIADFLIPTERILYHRLPKTIASTDGRVDFKWWAIGWVLIIASVFIFAFLPTTQTVDLVFFIIPIVIGIFFLVLGMRPVISYSRTKDIEIMITNQRVLIYPSPYAEKNRPKIINLGEVNGQIEMKYNKARNTGSIYIPSPHWDRIIFYKDDIPRARIPDLKNIKDPLQVYNILLEALEVGRKLNWKFS